MRSFLILALLSFFFLASSVRADSLDWLLLPSRRPVRLSIADPREIAMDLGFTSDAKMMAVVGNYFSFLGVQPDDKSWLIHFGIEGCGFFTLRSEGGRFPLETVDGLVGLYAEGVWGIWQGQVRYTHISAHLADGSSGTPIAYSREFVTLKGAYVPDESAQAYVAFESLVNSTPSLPALGAEWGGSYFLPLGSRLTPFAALDMKWRQETVYNPSFSLQLGVALNRPPDSYRSFRLYYAYYTGQDPRGQYYMLEYTSHSIVLEMQI
jgi:hypothetical protein